VARKLPLIKVHSHRFSINLNGATDARLKPKAVAVDAATSEVISTRLVLLAAVKTSRPEKIGNPQE
jgi:hypothetical protein